MGEGTEGTCYSEKMKVKERGKEMKQERGERGKRRGRKKEWRGH